MLTGDFVIMALAFAVVVIVLLVNRDQLPCPMCEKEKIKHNSKNAMCDECFSHWIHK